MFVRDRFHFQTDEVSLADELAPATGDADAGAAVDVGGDGADIGEETSPDAAETAPAWAGVSQDEWEEMREMNQELLQTIRGWQAEPDDDGQQQQGQSFDPTALDPFSDDFGSTLQQMLRAEIQQAITPISQQLGTVAEHTAAQQSEQGNEIAKDIIADYAKSKGIQELGDLEGFDQAVMQRAEKFIPGFQERYSDPGKAITKALEHAADQEIALLNSYADRKLNAHKAGLDALGSARSELPGSGSGSAVVGFPEARDELDIAAYYTGTPRRP